LRLPSAEVEAADLGIVVGGLVGELGADLHRVIIDREAPEQGVADQDLVQHLRGALEHLGVALGLDQAHWALSTRRPADPQFIVTAPNVLLQCLPRRTTLAQRSLEPAHRTWLERHRSGGRHAPSAPGQQAARHRLTQGSWVLE
jgi:hypothetical protein